MGTLAEDTLQENNVHLQSQIGKHFAAPVVVHDWPNATELNAKLTDFILEKQSIEAGIHASNSMGWHSVKDLHLADSEAVQHILASIRCLVKTHAGRTFPPLGLKLEIEAWANINVIGHANDLHHHVRNMNLLSGVYFVADGAEEKRPAHLVLEDPFAYYENHNSGTTGLPIAPKPGRMVLFPSALPHRVEAHAGRSARISIGFNVRHLDYTSPLHEIRARIARRDATLPAPAPTVKGKNT